MTQRLVRPTCCLALAALLCLNPAQAQDATKALGGFLQNLLKPGAATGNARDTVGKLLDLGGSNAAPAAAAWSRCGTLVPCGSRI